MINRISKMPGSILIILVWIVVWCLVATKNIAPALSGKGTSHIGNEYYRFLTAGLTHTSLIHLLVNVCAMFWIGYLYEHQVGLVKFLAIGIMCAVISQVIFLCVYHNATESVGGSAYNFALCGFGLAMQFMVPEFPKMQFGTWSGSWLIIYLVASNIPVLSFMNVTTIVFHVIAFVVGIVAAFVCHFIGIG